MRVSRIDEGGTFKPYTITIAVSSSVDHAVLEEAVGALDCCDFDLAETFDLVADLQKAIYPKEKKK